MFTENYTKRRELGISSLIFMHSLKHIKQSFGEKDHYLRYIDSIVLFSRSAPARLENPYLHFQS